ncbi:MAG: alpha/beta hydrolase [Chitinophagaceae bacterium]
MKKFLFLFCFLFFNFYVFAQYSLRLIVTDVATKKLDDIYVAGSFNNWNPDSAQYKLKPFGQNRKAIVLDNISAGKYAFKFTRGNWQNVETTAKGEDIANREIEINSDTSINIAITGWKDDYPLKPKPNTASMQVQILDTAFFMPQLNRYRRIWVYLPTNYNQSKKNYAVIYMQDGQNLFNEQTSAFGEWGIDECLDTLQQQIKKECIIVGIDHGGDKRMTEYNPYDNDKFGKGEGDLYVDFLAQTLKPFIDKKFRTLKDAQHTFIAGSSMGALISFYAVMKYPHVFGGAGIFSPSFWIAPKMYDDIQKINFKTQPRFYFYAGGKESETMVSDLNKMYDLLAQKKQCMLRELISPLGQHNETYWRKVFPDFYKWIMQ